MFEMMNIFEEKLKFKALETYGRCELMNLGEDWEQMLRDKIEEITARKTRGL